MSKIDYHFTPQSVAEAQREIKKLDQERIENFRREIAELRAENEALKTKVRELQEWHDSHL